MQAFFSSGVNFNNFFITSYLFLIFYYKLRTFFFLKSNKSAVSYAIFFISYIIFYIDEPNYFSFYLFNICFPENFIKSFFPLLKIVNRIYLIILSCGDAFVDLENSVGPHPSIFLEIRSFSLIYLKPLKGSL